MLYAPFEAISQTDTLTAGGRPFARIFSNYHTTFSEDASATAFELTRVYLGYQYQFNENFSAKVNLDVGNPGTGDFELTAYVKNAYLQYNAHNLTLNFGMISTTQFKIQEQHWGYRYLQKSFQDEYDFNSSADLGVSLAYKFSESISADLIVANGEGYKRLQADSALRTGFGITLHPLQPFTARVYYDFISKDYTQSSMAAFVGYRGRGFSLGAEYNKQFNVNFEKDREWSGTSFYATVNPTLRLKLFARYDRLTSNTLSGEANRWNHSQDERMVIAGVEYAPIKGVKLAPNYQRRIPDDNNQPVSSTIFLNCEVKF